MRLDFSNTVDSEFETLDTLIPAYFENKSEFDSYKKICDKENTQIKDIMRSSNLQQYSVGDITVSVVVQHKESMDEEKLIDLLEHSTYTNPETGCKNVLISSGLGIVKLKPYVDMDALEDAMYKGLIPEDVILKMSELKECKDVETLRISRKKKKEEDK